MSAPACSTCADTHRMTLGDREVPCTHCPTPCEGCRVGAYCATRPCLCICHRLVERLVRNGGWMEPIDFDDALEFAREQLAMQVGRNGDLRIVNALRALVASRSAAGCHHDDRAFFNAPGAGGICTVCGWVSPRNES